MQYLLGIAFGIVTMLGFGISDTFVLLGSRAYGAIKTAFLFYVVICAVSLVAALWLFSLSGFTSFVILLLAVTGIISFAGFAFFTKGLEVGNVSVVAPIASCWSVITIALSILFLGSSCSSWGFLRSC